MKIYVATNYPSGDISKIAFNKKYLTNTYVNEYETVDEPDDILLEDCGLNLDLPEKVEIMPAKQIKEMFDKKFQEGYNSIIKLTNEAILGLVDKSFTIVTIPKQFYDKLKEDLQKAGYTITRVDADNHTQDNYNVYFRME